MPSELDPSQLSRLSELIATHLGLHFPPPRWPDLARGLRAATGELGFEDDCECVDWLASGPLSRRQIEILASSLTVGETYFYRERPSFRVLEERVLPDLLARYGRDTDRPIRIWSAACCTGEEPYSLAIAVARSGLRDAPISILATDINPRFLKKAAEGIYGEWSFRDVPPGVKEQYFRKHGDRFEILSEIKSMVRFEYLNLAEDDYPSLLNQTNAMDLIFCRNILIYLGPEKIKRVSRRLTDCLAENGWLFVGAAETSQTVFSKLRTNIIDGAIVYRKSPPAPRTPTPATVNWTHSLPAASAPLPDRPVLPPTSRPPATAPEPVPDEQPLRRAREWYEQGRYVDVVEELAGRVSRGEGGAAAAALLSRAHANRGELSAALLCCESAINIEKLAPELHYLRGSILQERGESEQASMAFQRAIYLEPNFVLAHFALGHLALSQEKRSEAARHFGHAATLLRSLSPETALPESDGLTAGRLAEVVAVMLESATGGLSLPASPRGGDR